MRKIPKKNYFILVLVFIITIALLYYFYMWYSAYNTHQAKTSVMEGYVNVVNYNEINNYILENEKVYVYVSKVNDDNITTFEKEFKKDLSREQIKNKILYMNVTSILNNNKNLKYGLSENTVPCILVFKNGTLESIYNIKENGYSADKTIAFLISKGVSDLW